MAATAPGGSLPGRPIAVQPAGGAGGGDGSGTRQRPASADKLLFCPESGLRSDPACRVARLRPAVWSAVGAVAGSGQPQSQVVLFLVSSAMRLT